MQVVAQIHQLTDGFVLELGTGDSVACSSVGMLTKAIRDHLPVQGSRGQLVAFPGGAKKTSPTPDQVRAALSPTPPTPPAVVPPVQSESGVITHLLQQLPADQMRAFYQIAHAWATGQLPNKDSLALNLQKYVPGLDPHAAEVILQEYVADHRGDDA